MRNDLGQELVWVDVHGREHRVERMSRRYAANCAAFLLRRAWVFQRDAMTEDLFAGTPIGVQAWAAWESEQAEYWCPAGEWMKGMPLYRALVARADGHPGGPSLRYRLRRLIGASS